MLIASKYEEIWAPELRDFIFISDKAYTRDQILQMEKVMLNTLSFNLTVPTAYNFLGRFLKVRSRIPPPGLPSVLQMPRFSSSG
jgi:G2/mitotic-specific cyclin-B, other